MSENNRTINVQPPTSIYSELSRISYKPEFAMAEFIDNSTASFFSHRIELRNNEDDYKLKIYIKNDLINNSIEIRDNAYGMEEEDFLRAFMLGATPKNRKGRNEFGMGLKTAACWFSKKWKITSSQFNSKNKYEAILDTEKLKIDKLDKISYTKTLESPEEHFTIIKLEDLNKRIHTGPQIEKMLIHLAGIYRQDISNKNVEIIYYDINQDSKGRRYLKDRWGKRHNHNNPDLLQPLTYEYPKFYIHEKKGELKKEIEGVVELDSFYGKEQYSIRGTIGVRAKGSREFGGFSLLRRGRVIIGGPDANYYDKKIFGSKGGFEFQRLFGEIHLDNWPVSQTKDAFDWDNGLEDLFIDKMNELCEDYKKECRKIRKDKQSDFDPAKIVDENIRIRTSIKETFVDPKLEKEYSVKNVEIKDENIISKNSLDKTFVLYLENNEQIEINYHLEEENENDRWFIIKENKENSDKKIHSYDIVLFLKHPFFNNMKINNDFLFAIRKFVISLATTIINFKFIYKFEKIDPFDLLDKLNNLLKINFEEKVDNEDDN